MTMPDKIYAIDARKRPDDSPSGVWSERRFTTRDAYIRADIVEELARALDAMLDNPEHVAVYMNDAMQALSRINAIMDGK